jgi:hypothetical protein
MEKVNVSIFTSKNAAILVNDKPLEFVQAVDVEDIYNDGEKYTAITLRRFANDNDDQINKMRSGPFSFKICNEQHLEYQTCGGYVALHAELVSFKMHLSVNDDVEKVNLLEQTIIIKARSFICVSNTLSDVFYSSAEKEEFDKLVSILKQNQEKDNRQNVVVLPAEDIKADNVKKAKKNKKK